MNLGDLKNYVKEYLECEETTFDANIDTFIQLAEEDIFRQVQLPDLKATATANMTVGDRLLAKPDDYLATYYLFTQVNGEFVALEQRDASFLREVYPTVGGTGTPRYYAENDDTSFVIGPTPDLAYPVELHYFFRPDSLTTVGDTGTSWLSNNAENALLFGTIVQGYIFLKGDQDVIAQYKEKYQQAVGDLTILAEGRNRKDTYRKENKRLPV